MEKWGYTGSACIPMALDDARAARQDQAGRPRRLRGVRRRLQQGGRRLPHGLVSEAPCRAPRRSSSPAPSPCSSSVAAAALVFWTRPLATLAWLGRRRLVSRRGFEKHFQASAVGPQCVFRAAAAGPSSLVHGAGDQAATGRRWRPAREKLRGRRRTSPGTARARRRAGPLSFATLLAGLDGAMKEVPQGKVTLVGNSLGAWVATVWAKEHPERVQHLVLVNGGPLLGDRPDLTLQPKNRAEADRTLQALRDPSAPMIPDFVVDDIIRVAATGPIARLAAEPKNLSAYLLDGKLSGFDVPVDLLWGASDKLVSLDYAERLAAQLPAARLTTIDRCGHAPAGRVSGTLHGGAPEGPQGSAARADGLGAAGQRAGSRGGAEVVISGDVLGERARLSPDKTALVEVATGRRFTYSEMDARAKAAARALTEGLGAAEGRPGRPPRGQPRRVPRRLLRVRQDRHRPRPAQHAADGGGAGGCASRTRSRRH